MKKTVKLLLILLISFPLTDTNAGTQANENERYNCSEGDDMDRDSSSADSLDSQSDQDKEPTSSEPASLPSFSDRIASSPCPEMTARVLELSKHHLSLMAHGATEPNEFSSKPRSQQASLLRLTHSPSSDMAILATLDQAHAPPHA